MKLSVVISGKSFGVELSRPEVLAIPLDFAGSQPTFFGAMGASSRPFQSKGFLGSTPDGGSCNVSEIRLVPHCNGTHTETIGHIIHDAQSVTDALPQSLFAATLITVTPVSAEDCGETCGPASDPSDAVVTKAQLLELLEGATDEEIVALVIRTRPNDGTKRVRNYDDGPNPPYFTMEAMRYLVARNVDHLLVDMPSIDQIHDGGLLNNHRVFWNIADGDRDLTPECRTGRTITEMVFVADEIPDGLYLLNLQLPAFMSDAAPSRPVLYPLIEDVSC
jgi:kynurenine formamidase